MSNQPWLFLFSISGVKLTSSESNPGYIFQDATLLSGEEARHLSTLPNALHPFFQHNQPADCYIAVKRGCDPDDGISHEKAHKSAKERAETIASVMAFWLFGRTKQTAFCGLSDNMTWRFSNVISFGYPQQPLETAGSVARSGARNIAPLTVVNANSYTRESFLKDIRQDSFKNLFDAVVMRDKAIGSQLQEALTRASERLAIGLYSQNLGEFIVATITALEILFAENDNKEKIIQKRYTTLVSHPLEKVINVYTERNNWIHRGTEVSKEQAFSALALGVSALLSVADLAFDMPSETTLSTFLGFLDVVAITNVLPDEAFQYFLKRMPNERSRINVASAPT